MPNENDKDIVGARINLDTSKIMPAFQKIDQAVKQNAAAFKSLNTELTASQKAYVDMAKAADKMALTSGERRKKIMDESRALVAQRTAQADLYKAKANAIDNGNKLMDAKLGAQLALQKRREDAIEQQEAYHQARLAKLMNAPIRSGSANMNVAAQYMLTGTLYYKSIQGAKEGIKVIEDFESAMVNLQRVMGQGTDFAFVKKSMIDDAKQYGYALKDVANVYVEIAQQGFNEKDTAMLAKTALMAANVESSFRDAAEAQQLLTGAVLNYNLQAKDSATLLDKINQVSNDYATDSKKLLEGINTVGAAAKNAGVPIDQLIGYLTVLNQAGFSGSEAGNALKSFISFSTRDIAIDKLEKYVGTIKQLNGAMMPFPEILDKVSRKWNGLSDAERNEVTQAIARGNQSSKFIALMNNYAQTVNVATTAENSFGSAQRENAKAMTTLEKQAAQLKAAWESLMVSIGDSGLLGLLKEVVHESKLLVDGFNSLPEPIRNTIVVTLSLGTAIAVLNTGARVLTGQTLVQLATGLATGARAMMGMTAATETATVAQRAFIATPIGAALTALSVIIGAVTVAWSHHIGVQNEANETLSENQKASIELAQRYKELKSIVDDNTKSDAEITTAQKELSIVIDQIAAKMPNLISLWDEHGKAIDVNIQKMDEFNKKNAQDIIPVESKKISDNLARANEKQREIDALNKEITASRPNLTNPNSFAEAQAIHTFDLRHANDSAVIHQEILDRKKELDAINQQIKTSQDNLAAVSPFIGPPAPVKTKTKTHTGEKSAKEWEAEFQDEKDNFEHLVNMESAGYQTAEQQLAKLQAIKSQFEGHIKQSEAFSLDEAIHRLMAGKKIKPDGLGGGTKAFQFPLNDIDLTVKQSQKMVDDVAHAIEEVNAHATDMSNIMEQTNKKVALYEAHQKALAYSNTTLRGTLDTLSNKQDELDQKYADGAITLDDYNKSSEDVQNRINQVSQAVDRNSIAWLNDAKSIKDAQAAQLQASFDFSEKWIAHQKAIGGMSEQGELEAQMRVQARYAEGTEQKMKADELVYSAKKAYMEEVQQMQDEEYRKLGDMISKEKQSISDMKQTELDRIQTSKEAWDQYYDNKIKKIDADKEAFDRSMDDQIRKIDDLMNQQKTENEDADYSKQLAEKQARLKVLEAGVGEESRQERKDLLKDIEQMQTDHNRTLERRALESQRKTLEDQKRVNDQKMDDQKKAFEEAKATQEKAFEAQKKAIEQHYDNLLKAFDNFTNDEAGRAELLKNIQISKENEKNSTILGNLDNFIRQYQAKMAMINQMGVDQKQLDLMRYNSNVDAWFDAQARGDQATMDRVHAENESLRSKYGIAEDTGKLQHFASGGIVKAPAGYPTKIMAHGGEMVLNPSQQVKLFDMIKFYMPKIDFSVPRAVNNYYYSFDNSINGGVNLNNPNQTAGLYDQRTGIISRQRSLGVKTR